MDKETMIHILNQHGIDVLYDVISDEVCNAYDKGYDLGLQRSWCEWYSTNNDKCGKSYDHGYEVGYHDALTSWFAHDRYGFAHDED